ncbi:TM0106 family RecB-like putative nuclease [Arachnia propionica]|uniref:TM0106 family RecB-like putative nuclease n=1 Tax=Arachnia propionica TaxID=1750 RepID=UPI001BA51B11|nr:TM0106 family RecB-like putative nuclease [Arachnia propionica]QUC13471.1 TM0106 family RecB-like putative nuclease [Arachnia propionica]
MTFLLDPYAARSCPVKTFNAFDPGTPKPEKPLDESLLEAFSGGSEFRESMLEALCRADDVVDLHDEGHNPAKTLAAMETGAPVIVGGCLPVDVTGHRTGCPDALVRGDDRPGGRPGYWPLRVKPYRLLEKQHNAKELRASAIGSPTTLEPLPGFRFRSYRQGVLLELAHHWRLLQACGRAATTPVAGVIGFDDHRKGMIVWVPLELRFLRTFSRTSANGYRLRSALERYDHEHGFRVHVAQQAMIREPDDPRPPAVRPIRVPECEWCAWWETCRPRMDDDDISLRISKTPLDVRELQTLMGLGITTVSQLADADVEALLPDYLPLTAHRDRSEARLRTAARRARMLKRGVALEKVSVDPIGVPRAPVEVDLDIETDDSDRTYLWGVLLTDRATGKQKYQHFSTFSYLSPSGELDLAADFARWLVRLARKHPGLLVYHYSDYEVVHLRRMAQRSGHPDLLAACDLVKEHFVDLFQLVRDNFVAVDGLGLKVVAAKGAGFSWRDEEPGGLNSQTWFATAVDGGNAAERKAARRRVLEYNEDDVRATWHVREWMERLDSQSDEDAQAT